jgi:hypothetical protein
LRNFLFPDLMAYDKLKAKAALLQRELPGTTFKVFAALKKFTNDDLKRRALDLGIWLVANELINTIDYLFISHRATLLFKNKLFILENF